MSSEKFISVVISNYNKAETIGKCLEAVFSSRYKNFEVVVVDDNSKDNSIDIIKKFPCRLICLEEHGGASKARNTGAHNSKGDIILFIDADCVLQKDTLSIINRAVSSRSKDVVIGGTYTKMPYDKGFFSLFQSVFINYSETKNLESPDYIAAHAMIINAQEFRKSNGFQEDLLPILEDVEFSHRLRRSGYRLVMNPEIQVQHIFNFSLTGSIRNAIKKSKYWTMYSLKNKDLLADSGTASTELKANVILSFLSLSLVILWIFSQRPLFLYPVPVSFILNVFISRKLLKAFYETGGIFFCILASVYYTTIYSFSVGTGVIAGMTNFLLKKGRFK